MTPEEAQKYIDSTKLDVSTLDELNKLLEAYKSLNPTTPVKSFSNKDEFIKRYLRESGIDADRVYALPDKNRSTAYKQAFKVASDIESSGFTNNQGLPWDWINPYVRTDYQKNDPLVVYKDNLDQINQLIKSKTEQQKQEGELEKEIKEKIPGELSASRKAYIESEMQNARDVYAGQIDPTIRQQLNVRGLLDSGDLPSELARGASSAIQSVEDLQTQLEQEDSAYIKDLAYKTTMKRELEGLSAARSQLTSQRETQDLLRNQNFQRQQQNLNDLFKTMLTERQAQTALSAQNAALKRQSEAASAQRKTDILGNISTTAGTIAGTAIAAKLGGPSTAATGVRSGVTT